MRTIKSMITTILVGICTLVALNVSAQSADNARFLSIAPTDGMPIIPIFEGWVANEDGSRTFSFGYINRNSKQAADLPLGVANRIEPAKYDGIQPTHFPVGRGTGIFSITVPAEEADSDVWWYLTPVGGGEPLKVPGRAATGAYELDFIRPRPQGALQPLAGFGTSGEQKAGLLAQVGEYNGTVKAGEPVVLSVNVKDPSDRDPTDPRFVEPLPVGVSFNKYQGPGDVVFARHESSTIPTNPYKEGSRRFGFWQPPAANEMQVEGGAGVASIYATFSQPGEYMVHTKVDNFGAPDSADGDQCCWTNIIQKVTVTP
ncbi:MAG: hypothetical protein ACI95C_001290 [Pseudohongiellaceae bacterium]|jgi:hypothetical protein